MRYLRRFAWYIGLYLKRYRFIIAASLVTFILFTLLVRIILPHIPKKTHTIYLGVVGSYSQKNLPEIVARLVGSGLTKIGDNGLVLPNLASKWEIDTTGKIFTFHLEPGLTWPKGESVVSKDIILNIPGVKVAYPNDDTITFETPEIFSPFPAILSHPIFNAKGETLTGYTVLLTQSGSGQLKNISLKSKNLNYLINVYNSNEQAITAFKLGSIDKLIDLTDNLTVKESRKVKIDKHTDYGQIVTLFFNTKDPTLSNKSIRQAIAYLLPDKSGGFPKAISPMRLDSWSYNSLVKTYDYSSERGHVLINDFLPKDNRTLNLELSTLPEYLKTADLLKSQLEKEGVNISLKVVTSIPENYQLYLGLHDIPDDPDQYPYWHSTQNTSLSKIEDPKLDKLLEDGRTTHDQKKRKQIYLEFQKVLLEELPALFLYYPDQYEITRI
mgnify:CR=1 FL=1